MANYSGANFTSQIQTMSQPPAGQFNPHISPGTFSYSANMINNGQPMHLMPSMSQPYPQSPGALGMGSDQGVMSLILQRLDVMDKKLGQLDSIQSSINNVTVKVSDIEVKVKELEKEVSALEDSRNFDSESVERMNSKQKEVDSLLKKNENS